MFDTLLTLTDGRKVAIAVKYEADAAKSGLEDILYRIKCNSVDRAFADQFIIRTQRHITKTRVENARLILRARMLRNEDDIAALAKLVAGYKGHSQLSRSA